MKDTKVFNILFYYLFHYVSLLLILIKLRLNPTFIGVYWDIKNRQEITEKLRIVHTEKLRIFHTEKLRILHTEKLRILCTEKIRIFFTCF